MPRRKPIPKQQLQAEAEPTSDTGDGSASSDPRHDAIAQAAYYRAERRGFAPGNDIQDWLDAERDLDGDEQQRS
jgi:hypothetical protein